MPPPAPTPFVSLVLEMMAPLGGISAKKMFGGWGIFSGGLMFAVVIRDELYFKVDDENLGRFESRGLKPFTYEAKGRAVSLRYFQAPPETLEEPQAMANWARSALDCALRQRRHGG
ncbi:TfoX/Sxy family protein [Azohydromonas aeria]|uniref:TfoX/Sxy family protein n=1 Tax=Azohydromonas aeria TaxID=2590212 RepID=UPI0012F8CC15|nr:TfoX/Sxy family protein [Azohydromonas aeria]